MDNAGYKAEYRKQYVYPEGRFNANGKKYTQGGKNDGEYDAKDIHKSKEVNLKIKRVLLIYNKNYKYLFFKPGIYYGCISGVRA